jgi:hypothetical protein
LATSYNRDATFSDGHIQMPPWYPLPATETLLRIRLDIRPDGGISEVVSQAAHPVDVPGRVAHQKCLGS